MLYLICKCKHVLESSFFSLLFGLIGVSISQLFMLDLFDPSRCKPGFLHGLTVVISLVCVCVGGCVCESVPAWWMRLAGPFLFVVLALYSQFCCSVVENDRRPPASTGTTHSPLPRPPSVNQQAEWILMEPMYPASVNNLCCPRHCFIDLRVFSQVLHDTGHFSQSAIQSVLCFQLSLCMFSSSGVGL